MFQKAVIAGLAATVVMSLVGYFVPPLMGSYAQDSGAMLGVMMIKEAGMMQSILGWVIHLVMGAVVFAFVYAKWLHSALPGNDMVKGVIWGVVLYIIYGAIVQPMYPGLLMGNFGFNMDFMFFGGDILSAGSLWSLVTHALYGLVLGLMYKPD